MYAYVAFLVVLLTFGMETAFFRFVNNSDHPNKIYNTALLPILFISILFMSCCLLFAGQLADLISYPNHKEFVSWFAIIVGLDAITAVPMARLRQENKATKFALINLASIGVNISFVLFFIGYCKVQFEGGNSNWLIETIYNPEIGVGYIFIANLIASGFKFVLLLPSMAKLQLKIDPEILKKMMIYAGPLLVAGLAGIANENIDRLLLKYLLLNDLGLEDTMTQVGIYGACYKISILITLFVQAYRYAAEPFFFNQSKQEDAKQTYAMMMKYFVIVCLVLFLGLMININTVMYFVGEEYRIGVSIVPILLMANIFLGIYYNLSVWYKLTDKTSYGAYISIFGAIITVVANMALIPILGFEGSAWATLMCYTSMMILSFFLGRKHYSIPYPLKRITLYFVLTCCVYIIIQKIGWTNEMTKIIIGNLTLIIAVGLIYATERPKIIIT